MIPPHFVEKGGRGYEAKVSTLQAERATLYPSARMAASRSARDRRRVALQSHIGQ